MQATRKKLLNVLGAKDLVKEPQRKTETLFFCFTDVTIIIAKNKEEGHPSTGSLSSVRLGDGPQSRNR